MSHKYKSLTSLPEEPFRAYDIRSDIKFLTEDVVYTLGKAIANELLQQQQSTIILGRDGRLSSPKLMQALQAGITEVGVNIVDLGIVSSPMVYFATHTLPFNSGISLTASHNPKNHNGLKIIINGKSLSAKQLQDLKSKATQPIRPSSTPGKITTKNIQAAYIETINQQIQLSKRFKVVVDCGNGTGSEIAPKVFRALGCEVIELFCEIDGNFPNHHPDPSCPENLIDLQNAVIKHKADIGLAFDGDADRLGVVSNTGDIIWPDKQMIIFTQDILQQHPKANIVFDVKCSDILAKAIESAGGKPIMWKTGHSLIKSKMHELQAPLAGEMSGHIFFGSPWFGFDDGVYAGARFLQYLDKSKTSFSNVVANLPITFSTHELKVPVIEAEKNIKMTALVNNLPKECELNDIDGLRLNFNEGWMLVRQSNTTSYLTIRYESNTKEGLSKLKTILINWLSTTCPDLDLTNLL